MRQVEFEVDGERYLIEVDDDVLSMSQQVAGAWVEVARLTVAAASLLADLDVVETPPTLRVVADAPGDEDRL